ncbi:MAG: enoyl-CoA hydratase-related protein [Azospirillaceae bacterium]|nr:enoyl-CoA hydratase-related protein [Azospirillaceae bacterium]
MTYARYDKIDVVLDGAVLRVTLNNPEKRNIIDDETNRQLSDVFVDASFDPAVKVVVLTGAGAVFSAGGDIVKMQRKIDDPGLFYKGVFNSRRLVFSVLDCPKPVVARVHGDAVGLGATLALLCDIVIADEEAKFLDPHVNVGLVAGDGGALLWPHLVGYARAKRYLLAGEPILGREAADIGLIAFAVPSAELDALTEKWAAKFARSATQSVAGTKITLNVLLRQAAQAVLDVGMAYEGLSNITKDHQEAVTAFMEKRRPNFTGD